MHIVRDPCALHWLDRLLGTRKIRRVGAAWLLLLVAAVYIFLGLTTTRLEMARVTNVFRGISCKVGGNVSEQIKRFMTEEDILERQVPVGYFLSRT
jgi:hypothetical protein